jgi:DNA-binding XRE family transcriptional regulator
VAGSKEDGVKDKVITFKLNKSDWDLIEKYDAETDEVTCRVVVVPLPDGGNEMLCTSLMDAPYEVFSTPYHYRWNIEEGYKLYKCRLELEEFSGKTTQAVYQDFFAKVFMMTTTAVMPFPIEEKLKAEQKLAPQALQKKFGEHVKAIREKKGMSQQDVADNCSLYKGWISKIENGKRTVTLNTIFELAKRLEIQLTKLFEF